MKQRLGLLLSHLGAAVLALHFGILYSLQQHAQQQIDCAKQRAPDLLIVERVAATHASSSSNISSVSDFATSSSLLPATIRDLVVGGACVTHDDFQASFDLGFPLGADAAKLKNSHVLLLYQSLDSLPANYRNMTNNQSSTTTKTIFPVMASLSEALENCDVIRHISMPVADTKHRNAQTCTVLVGQTEADYIQKWIRPLEAQAAAAKKSAKQASGAVAASDILQRPPIIFEAASRYKFDKGSDYNAVQTTPGVKRATHTALSNLNAYLHALPAALERLRPIAERVAKAGSSALVHDNIIVMVTNFGHAELFINFCCAARRAGMDLSKVLLFATDQDTYDLANAMGVAAFYDEDIFASIPRDASANYGDMHYGKIMMSKVYCVHMVSLLHYNYLFQDVDIIPYSDRYLEWFVELSQQQPAYDMFFQNDHNYRAEYSPYMTNSGCYYVKSNARTQHFLADFIKRGDAITQAKSHQAAMSGLLTEHVKLYGLRPKTLWGDDEVLLIGWHFHRNVNDVMKKLFQSNKTSALSLHMNWNSHKEEKRPFLEQTGDWYLFEPCVGDKTLTDIESGTDRNADLVTTCCSATPLYKCHFKDKPSMLPCESNKTYTKRSRKSFW